MKHTVMEERAVLLRREYADHPAMEIADAVKFLYQSVMGCEHLLENRPAALRRIREEMAEPLTGAAPVTDLGDYIRLDLPACRGKLRPETVCALFCRTAEAGGAGQKQLREALPLVYELPFDRAETAAWLQRYEAAGMPPVRHSEAYRRAYAPHYRVIRRTYLRLLPLLERMDRQEGRVLAALDGPCAAGKTTMAAELAAVCDCNVFHMDDFFLPPEKRTPQRLAEAGGNVDYERFLQQVLLPLSRGEPVHFAPYDCSSGGWGEERHYPVRRLNLVEGSYSLHPALRPYYDIKACMELDPQRQMDRIIKRNGPEMAERFRSVWIPLENDYFRRCRVREESDLLIPECL